MSNEDQNQQQPPGREASDLTHLLATRASIETEYSKVCVEVKKRDLSLPDLIEQVIEPLLLGAGYRQKTIDEYFRG